MAYNKIGFHTGPAGNERGIGDWMKALAANKIPFFITSVDYAGPCWEAQQYREAEIVFRLSTSGQMDGNDYDTPMYALIPREAAAHHWQITKAKFPPELDKNKVWIAPINEPDKNRSDWLGWFAVELANLAHADGYKVTLFSFSTGEPEKADWETPGMLAYLRLCAERPHQAAVSLHEYSLTRDDIRAGFPHLIGRFQFLNQVCDERRIARPTIHITEWGWEYNRIPDSVDTALAHIRDIAAVYSQVTNVSGAATWYLGGGFGGIANQVQRLIAPVTDMTINTTFPDPPPLPGPGGCMTPRIDYSRDYNYVAYPEQLSEDQIVSIFLLGWRRGRQTFGGSADDAGLGSGCLTVRRIHAFNIPDGERQVFLDWWNAHYPGAVVNFEAVPAPFAFGAWPTTYRTVTQPFGANPDYYRRFGLPGHEGVDFASPIGAPVYAALGGTVSVSRDADGSAYGTRIYITHTGGWETRYAHLQRRLVQVGQTVNAGQQIGTSGDTGNATGPHLHFTLIGPWTWTDGAGTVWPQRIHDPTPYLDKISIPPPPPPPGTGPSRFGLHASADAHNMPGDLDAFRESHPDMVKVLSSHAHNDVATLAAQHPSARWVVRIFLSFGGRNISPEQFVRDTIDDVRRTVGALSGKQLVVEIHNEPNLTDEGLGSTWANGAEFNAWLIDVRQRLLAAIPGTRFIYPGLSPGGTIPGIREDHWTFVEACRPVISLLDGIGVHIYWAHDYPMSTALTVLDGYVTRFPGKQIWITEACNNKLGTSAENKAAEYITFHQQTRSRSAVQGVTYFVSSASDPSWGWGAGGTGQTWAGTVIPHLVGKRTS